MILEIEELDPNDVVTCLWNKNAAEKCRIGLTDTILYEGNVPSRWYVTGKTGEIVKKRGIDMTAISQRWIRIAAQNESSVVGILRQANGVYKLLGNDAWSNFIASKSTDSSIKSVHCFIKGSNNTIFRNVFQLKDKLGRFSSHTYSYTYNLNQMNANNEDFNICVVSDKHINLVEVRATSLKNIMDLATNTVIRYVENMLQIRILNISIDYAIDSKSQLWMLWTSPAKFVKTTNIADANIPAFNTIGDKKGRMTWAGPKYFEGVDDVKDRRSMSPGRNMSPSTPKRTKSRSPYRPDRSRSPEDGPRYLSPSKKLPLYELDVDKDYPKHSETSKSDIPKLQTQLTRSASELEDVLIPKVLSKVKGTVPGDLATPYVLLQSENTNLSEKSFPDPFKCKGDFCKARIHTVGALSQAKGTKMYNPEHFFTDKEMEILRKDKRCASMMEFGADGPALAVISMKSVILARQERRGDDIMDPLVARDQSWKNYPITPRERPHGTINLTGHQLHNDDSNGIEEMKKQHKLDEKHMKDRDHVDSFTKQVASYYDQVRVCGMCNNVYCMLDWARGILGRGDAHGAWKEAEKTPKKHHHKSNSNNDGNGDLATESIDKISMLSTSLQSSDEEGTKTSNTGRKKKGKMENDKDKRTWKDYEIKEDKNNKSYMNKKSDRTQFADLDDYLRAGADTLAARKARDREVFVQKRMQQLRDQEASLNEGDNSSLESATGLPANMYRGTVLLAFAADTDETVYAYEAKAILEEAYFDVVWARDGRQAINEYLMRENGFDCVITQIDTPLSDAYKLVKVVREQERLERKKAAAEAAAQGHGIQPATKRHSVIVYTDKTSPDDLKSYMKSDMDGCVSYPVNKASLLNTIRAAIPHHLALMKKPESPPKEEVAKVFKLGQLGEMEGSNDSATMAAKTLPISEKSNDDEFAYNGVVQIDADTRLPYILLDASRSAKVLVNPNKPFFNLIVCHDLFDTSERMKIFLRPIVQKYLGMQVLLWNQAGQAFTEWREEQLINNEYHANCLNDILGQLGNDGTKDFDTSRPFYILGYGSGSHIATFYASHYRVPNLRGIISVNGWSYIDSFLAGAMHDCVNIFQCTPPARPDLPVYFFSRFLFSKDYLSRVSVPLALNLYTAVYNPISLAGRVNLCKGVLGSVDIRPLLKEIDCPIICIHSTQDNLSRPLHTEPFITYRAGEVRSIYKVLHEPAKTCVIWMKGGHEVFQENRKQSQLLIEQILTGFHESHDISFPPASVVDKASAEQGQYISSLPWDKSSKLNTKSVEDKYVDSVLTSMTKLAPSDTNNFSSTMPGRIGSPSSIGRESSSVVFSSSDPNAWSEYSDTMAKKTIVGKKKEADKKDKKSLSSSSASFSASTMDPTSAHFAKQDSIYSKNNPNIHEYPEVKEYMGWRLKRNKKRLQRLQAAARTLQAAFRAYVARQMVRGIRRRKAASTIQRAYRGWIGRCTFLSQARRIWGAQAIQRAWRGYLGRKFFWHLRLRLASAANIQRVYRGYRTRLFVNEIRRIRYKAASLIQALFRRNAARREAFRRRYQRNCSVTLQRVYRGHLGRRRAFAERDKYIFSRSQSHGIEFGRQMLLEHKLHATRLQSDVTLLTQEKVGAEEQVEALLEEISTFEEGVRTLEKEMHQLSKVEAEAAAYMDDESKSELREQKIKLDKEFGEMLGKIGNRKDLLDELERKLSSIDKARQVKEEELRTLERKLVVLLEEQQNELNAIKRKQDVRGAMLQASHQELLKAASGAPGSQTALITADSKAITGGGGSGGPSVQERRQAAQLMQSTETLMKFGFMSMSMTYFSSLNMIKALRTVAAQDTVMAALSDVHTQRLMGGGADGGPHPAGIPTPSLGKQMPNLKNNQLMGQQSLRVSSWSVEDVSKWLTTLSLGQYSETFMDAAIDGEFLYDINDDDLKNTLGIEHRLHRKKILNCVHRLKLAEAQEDERLNQLLRASGSMEAPSLGADENAPPDFPANPFKPNGDTTTGDDSNREAPKVPLSELMSLTRHSKFAIIKEALDYLPNKKFDKTLIKVNYVTDHGTVYVEGYERLLFHINKTDEHGNTMLSLACQNGNNKICKYLITKGANPNHQNKQGQTPAHFAIAYKFFELSTWLFDNGADDSLENKYGNTCYDGLDGPDDD